MIDNAYKELSKFLNQNNAGCYLANEPIRKHTTYRIGGLADFFVFPREQETLIALLRECSRLDIDCFLLGGGANILASDDGYRGVIINIQNLSSQIGMVGTNQVCAGAGVSLQDLVIFCERNGLGGVECLSGIPGTVGGGLRMNAGTKKGEIGTCVSQVVCLDVKTLHLQSLSANDIDFNYRSVPQLLDKIILGCTLTLSSSNREELKLTRLRQLQERSVKQPLAFPSCGSVFKRPPKYYVGAMVEELGLKGMMRGDAMISEIHGGFISNMGCAKASEVMWLICHIQEKVEKNYNVVLEPEVLFLGVVTV